MEHNAMQKSIRKPPLDISTLQCSQNFPVTEHGGLGEVRVHGYGEQELHSQTPEACTKSKYEYEQSSGSFFFRNNRQGEVVTYPEGEAGAVTITEQDMEGLRPTEYLGNNIIDFYIKYLERKLSPEDRGSFHFFGSFFFAKILGINCASDDINLCKVDYDQARKWSVEVNLFEKDFLFIPIVRRSHWSLIIICHLRSLLSASGEKRGSPCILHLDSLKGTHENFKRQVRSYLSKTWMEKFMKVSDNNMDQLLDLCQMKYIQAEVPRQENVFDCGVYLLHYMEVFLSEVTSVRFAPRKGVPLFNHPQFEEEVSNKRRAIQELIRGLEASSGGCITEAHSNSVSVFDPHAEQKGSLTFDTKTVNGAAVAHEEYKPFEEVPMDRNQQVRAGPSAALPEPNKVSNKRKWTVEETLTLLNCKAEGGRLCKDNQTGMNWDSVSQEITNRLGTTPSAKQCRRRYKTLQKAYKSLKDYFVKTGRTFSEITAKERLELKLATTLNEEWYNCIDALFHKVKSQKRASNSGGDGTCQVSPSNLNHLGAVRLAVPAPAAMAAPISAPAPIIPFGKSIREQVAIPGFCLKRDAILTLMDLIMVWQNEWTLNFDEICRKVAIVRDRKPFDIRMHLFHLEARKLVNYHEEASMTSILDFVVKVGDLVVYKKFVENVLCENPEFDIYQNIRDNNDIVSYPEAPVSLSVHQIRVLVLCRCWNLQRVDLSFFPELRYLHIDACSKLEKVTGWEVVKELGYLEIGGCVSYKDFPPVQWLPSLREFKVYSCRIEVVSVPDFSQCVLLRVLEIRHIDSSVLLNGVDLSTLRCLKVLDLSYCGALTTIQGLSRLHSLTTLVLVECRALRRVPELGCLKALTELDMMGSGVEVVSGVQELHSLTLLDLSGCRSLETLPCLGKLTALTRLDISGSGVKVIPGVRDLISLEELHCGRSRLKWLPDLHHLPELRSVFIYGTPWSTIEIY